MSETIIIDQRDVCLRVALIHKTSIELDDLSQSLKSLAALHNRYVARTSASIAGDRLRLYVREIRSGSIIVDLIAQAHNLSLFADDAKHIVDFAKVLMSSLDFFKGKAEQPDGLKKPDAENIRDFLEPVARDTGAIINIQALAGSTVIVNQATTSIDANAIQNRAGRWIDEQKEPVRGIQTGCLFYFYQARDELSSRSGDLGVIERISTRPVKTIIEGEDLKGRILGDALFRKAYVVTVRVETIEDKPMLYTILEVTDMFDRP